MHDFWNQVILSNSVRKYFIVAGTILLGILFKRIISRFIAGFLYRLVNKMATGLDKSSFVTLVMTPLQTFLVILVSMSALEKLQYPEELDFDIYEINVKSIVHTVAIAVFIIAFIWLVLRIIDFVAMILQWRADATKDLRDNQLVVFFRDFLKIIIGTIGVLMILGFGFGFDVGKLWTGLGIAGAALALATKESIENLIASFIIFFDKPFTQGDIVKVNDVTGTVERIGLRSTRVRTDQKTYVTVPNKQMVDTIVDNQSLRTQRKGELRLQVGLQSSSGSINQFIGDIKNILKKDYILDSAVFLNDITATAMQINVDYFTPPVSQKKFNEIKQEINMQVLKTLESLEIEIAGASTDIKIVNKKDQ